MDLQKVLLSYNKLDTKTAAELKGFIDRQHMSYVDIEGNRIVDTSLSQIIVSMGYKFPIHQFSICRNEKKEKSVTCLRFFPNGI